jgi:hypothetical protein
VTASASACWSSVSATATLLRTSITVPSAVPSFGVRDVRIL